MGVGAIVALVVAAIAGFALLYPVVVKNEQRKRERESWHRAGLCYDCGAALDAGSGRAFAPYVEKVNLCGRHFRRYRFLMRALLIFPLSLLLLFVLVTIRIG